MIKEDMAEIVVPVAQDLRAFGKRCMDLAETMDRTVKNQTSGENIGALQGIMDLLNHPWFLTSKGRPSINEAKTAFCKNARHNAEREQARIDALLAPFEAKKGRRKAETSETTTEE